MQDMHQRVTRNHVICLFSPAQSLGPVERCGASDITSDTSDTVPSSKDALVTGQGFSHRPVIIDAPVGSRGSQMVESQGFLRLHFFITALSPHSAFCSPA